MKKPITVKQYIDFSMLLNRQEKCVIHALDELVIIETIVKNQYSLDEDVCSLANGYKPKHYARAVCDALADFPITRCNVKIAGIEDYYQHLGNISFSVKYARLLVNIGDLVTSKTAKNHIEKLRAYLGESLELIGELKQKNGIE